MLKLARTVSIVDKKGFTLAEVLITLTIIGIIAAMTIPTLLSKHQKHTYVTRVKKVRSLLENAIRMIPVTEGCGGEDYECANMFSGYRYIDGAYTTIPTIDIDNQSFNGIAQFKNAYLLSKNLQNVKLCYGDPSGCFAEGFDTAAFVENMDTSTAGYMVLADGTYLAVKQYCFFSVDVNGPQGPNKWGRDWFLFDVSESQGGETALGVHPGNVLPVGSWQYSMHGFGDNSQYWRNTGYCTTSNVESKSSNATHCTGRVFEEDAMNY